MTTHARETLWNTTQRLLRCGVGVSMLMLACLGDILPTESNAESPLESAEVAVECISQPRVTNPCESDGPGIRSVRVCSGATNPYSPTHNLLAAPTKGHALPNGLSAPLRC